MSNTAPPFALPFPALPIPPYFECARGDWTLRIEPRPHVAVGYFSGDRFFREENWTLRQGCVGWMNSSHMELESNALHVHVARGHVLVGGLGMGVLLYSLLLKPEVESVLVIERDAIVIEIMREVMERRAWPNQEKLEVEHGDVMERSSRSFDVGFIDIWPIAADPRLRRDMQNIARVRPAVSRWAAWTQELDFIDWLWLERGWAGNGIKEWHMRRQWWRDYSTAIGVQLIDPPDLNLPALAWRAVRNNAIGSILRSPEKWAAAMQAGSPSLRAVVRDFGLERIVLRTKKPQPTRLYG